MPAIPIKRSAAHSALRQTRGLYAITPVTTDTEALLLACEQVLAGGAVLLQYRGKELPAAVQYPQAAALAERCRAHRVPFLINDDIALCLALDAAGVHLGRSDCTLAEARAQLGPAKLIGISCYNEWQRACAAQAGGADYLAFGACFASPTKPHAVTCPPSLLQQARQLGLPVVAIGGITAENGASLVAAGADLLAVISDVFQAQQIAERVAQYRALFR